MLWTLARRAAVDEAEAYANGWRSVTVVHGDLESVEDEERLQQLRDDVEAAAADAAHQGASCIVGTNDSTTWWWTPYDGQPPRPADVIAVAIACRARQLDPGWWRVHTDADPDRGGTTNEVVILACGLLMLGGVSAATIGVAVNRRLGGHFSLIWAILFGLASAVTIGLVLFGGVSISVWWEERRSRLWRARHPDYLEALQAIGIEQAEDCRKIHSTGVTADELRPWTTIGVHTAFHWRLVAESGITLTEARRWADAGLDARFAATATTIGASLEEVRALVEDFLAGTQGRADLDDAWSDLVDDLDLYLGGWSPTRAKHLLLADRLAFSEADRQAMRTGDHWINRHHLGGGVSHA